jgi:hypothetical protein|tara:strand:+ start:742 stop:1179 length:438 start_codon:yes stop_codon:yes gene_type:complete
MIRLDLDAGYDYMREKIQLNRRLGENRKSQLLEHLASEYEKHKQLAAIPNAENRARARTQNHRELLERVDPELPQEVCAGCAGLKWRIKTWNVRAQSHVYEFCSCHPGYQKQVTQEKAPTEVVGHRGKPRETAGEMKRVGELFDR